MEECASRKELALILLLCFVAALRVFIFSAGFPFFSSIDEDLHFDLITQYSHACPPRTFDRLKEETLAWIVPYASPEFLLTPDQFPGAKFPPPLWKQSGPEVAREIAATKGCLEHRNQLRILSATSLLRARKLLVVAGEANRVSGHSIVVLDSFFECSADRDLGLAGVCDGAHSCA